LREVQVRLVRYNVAASLDGFIADREGRYDWIPEDPAVDFDALFARVDTVLLGRASYETVLATDSRPWDPNARVLVFSRTLRALAWSEAELVAAGAAARVAALRAEPGDGEIWLFGGGALCRDLLAAGQVDSIEVTVVPVLLGDGVPLVAAGIERTALHFVAQRLYPSGMVTLTYAAPAAQSQPR
jgi:dihydrofolate reductase